MKLSLSRFAAIAALCLPFQVHAVPFTLTIEGVDSAGPSGSFSGTPTPLPGVFVGLGNCTAVDAPASCSGSAENNLLLTPADVAAKNAEILANTGIDPNFSNALIFGYNFPMDQVIFHLLDTPIQFDDANLAAAISVTQGFDFIVGSTGNGTAGTGADDCSDPANPQFSHQYSISLGRKITITNDTDASQSLTLFIPQSGLLCVGGIDTDWVTILASAVQQIDLTQIGGTSTVNVQLGGHDQISQGDPDIEVVLSPTAVPLPSTVALLGVGLLGFARRRGRRA